MFLYHYTNQEDFKKILDGKCVRISPHGKHGPGVYLTSLTPDKGRDKIKKNNLDGVSHKPEYNHKTEECYLKFKEEDLDDVRYIPTKGGRDVWLYSNAINLRDISYYSGYTDYSEKEQYHPCASVVSFAKVKYDSDSDDDDGYPWYSNAAVSERQSASRSTYGYGTGRDPRSISYGSSSQQQQQQSDGIGWGSILAGAAAVVAVGATAIFAASRQSQPDNEQQDCSATNKTKTKN